MTRTIISAVFLKNSQAMNSLSSLSSVFLTFCFISHGVCFLMQKNVKEMMDVNGIRVLVDLLTLAHLHTSRAVVPLQVIPLVHWSQMMTLKQGSS